MKTFRPIFLQFFLIMSAVLVSASAARAWRRSRTAGRSMRRNASFRHRGRANAFRGSGDAGVVPISLLWLGAVFPLESGRIAFHNDGHIETAVRQLDVWRRGIGNRKLDLARLSRGGAAWRS